jgi:CPA2 family monovalent cation:H+ antiporter-2
MPHTPLIATIVAGLGLAFVLGALAHRLRLSPLVGYLVAGVVIGPFTPGFVADQALARQLAELGVVLLMFGIGLRFSFAELNAVRSIAAVGALGQMALVSGLGFGLARAAGWSAGAGIVFGLALSVASTVVAVRALQERHLIETEAGRIAVGWLVVEDIAMILALVLLPAFADALGGTAGAADGGGLFALPAPTGALGILALTLGKLVAFFAVMLVVGRRLIPWLLHYVAHTGSRELFRLAVLAVALGVAFGAAELFGVSFALGAFFAGMFLAGSPLSQSAAQETLPLRDAFAVLFFVSVGMLFDPRILLREPLLVAATLCLVVLANGATVAAIARGFRRPRETALTLGVSLSQIGEFSFILAGLGVDLALLPEAGRGLVLAAAMLSILLNPVLFVLLDRLMARWAAGAGAATAADAEAGEAPERPPALGLTGHAVLVGYGAVGRGVAQAIEAAGLAYAVIEERQAVADELRARGRAVVVGNAAEPGRFEAANLGRARWLISAVPDPFESGNLIERARALNPGLEILAHADSEAEVEYLSRLGASLVVVGEREIARGLAEHLLRGLAPPPATPGAARPEPTAG